ncbi:MAG: hypothetical protein WC513_09295 [Bacteroidales bacterium]
MKYLHSRLSCAEFFCSGLSYSASMRLLFRLLFRALLFGFYAASVQGSPVRLLCGFCARATSRAHIYQPS